MSRRVTAVMLLGLLAFFTVAMNADPCEDGECEDAPCQPLCVDGCTSTPVPAIARQEAPLAEGRPGEPLLEPLQPSSPALDGIDQPPRAAR